MVIAKVNESLIHVGSEQLCDGTKVMAEAVSEREAGLGIFKTGEKGLRADIPYI